MVKEKQKKRLCANYYKHGVTAVSALPAQTGGGVNCKECVFFSAKNCGADLGKYADRF